MKILIIGSGGRLGAALQREYSARHEVEGLAHRDLDLASACAVRESLTSREFDVLINCAALTNVDYCETHREEAMRVNAAAARELAEHARAKGARCIHISTDYVFDGSATVPYLEADDARPISIYGASKRAGEIEVLAVNDQNLVVRVSWVFGPDRPSFVDAILKRALASDYVDAVGDKFASPTLTTDIAAHLEPLLCMSSNGGLLHLCNAGGCTWRDYGEFAIRCALEAGVPMKTDTVISVPMADMKAFVAKRPRYTVMATAKLKEWTDREPRPWQEAVKSYVLKHFAPQHSPKA